MDWPIISCPNLISAHWSRGCIDPVPPLALEELKDALKTLRNNKPSDVRNY